jgi:hypothetical protein
VNAETVYDGGDAARPCRPSACWLGDAGAPHSTAAVSARSSIAPSHEQVSQAVDPDSGEHMLYSLDVAEGVLLTVAVRPDAPLRIVRSKTRQAADALIALSQ